MSHMWSEWQPHPKPDGARPATAFVDGNQAAARIAYMLSEIVAIYPITPASPMGELADSWAAQRKPNLWGTVPEVVEMQSEAGAAGAIHGGLMAGALSTTFTASQGLLLMLPNMFKLAGELTPAVIHVAARAVATHALSIFGDHSDVMAARTTGWAMLASSSVQEAQDMAAIAHAVTLEARVPFLHFFDGFRTSHEINRIELLSSADVAELLPPRAVTRHRARALTPDRPVLRGTAQDPDVFFQAREAVNPYYSNVPRITRDVMRRFAEMTGRDYDLIQYVGAPDADRVIVAMGSGTGAIEEAVSELLDRGERVGAIKVRLFRPFPVDALVEALPLTTRSLAVLDRTKEPGAIGEPLYQDVVTALAGGRGRARFARTPAMIGGRYGLASKEFTPAMALAVFDELASSNPKPTFTVGIVDDVTRLSLKVDPDFHVDRAEVRAVLYGLGSDGTVGSAKNLVSLVGDELHGQSYSKYDSKKSGSITVSHVRLSHRPIRSTYLVARANFVACNHFSLLERMDILAVAERGANFLLNSPYPPEDLWEHLPARIQQAIWDKDLVVHTIDAHALAKEAGLSGKVSGVLQPCFFALTQALGPSAAGARVEAAIKKRFHGKPPEIVQGNLELNRNALAHLHRVPIPAKPERTVSIPVAISEAPDFVTRVTKKMMAGQGDLLPVSALPADGAFPTDTARWEKRSIAQELPVWDPEICIDCGHCVIVCPHAALRMNVYDPGFLDGAPEGFRSKPFRAKELEDHALTIQLAPDDCTGCGVCVDVCPVKSKTMPGHKALNMRPTEMERAVGRANYEFFSDAIPVLDPGKLDPSTVKGSQVRRPLFEFPGACAGCGETPYLKLLSQLFGDRLLIANATGCSSIYGGNLPTTPWARDDEGRGPAWANSLFEDNAEFGFGMRLAVDKLGGRARTLLEALAPEIGSELASEILASEGTDDTAIEAQRERVCQLKKKLHSHEHLRTNEAGELAELADLLVPKSVWTIGGDGWAYDIGSGGLDHVLASGRNVNILVLDTQVYSNTGGQASKATPRAAVAKFAAKGKTAAKKDLGLMAMSYGDVYVAQIALGANHTQTIKALIEAERWPGPSLVIAYSTCIAHGIEMSCSMSHQKEAVSSGYWPLFRYHPAPEADEHPFQLDSRPPTLPFGKFAEKEERFLRLGRTDPALGRDLLQKAQADIDARWRLYSELAAQR